MLVGLVWKGKGMRSSAYLAHKALGVIAMMVIEIHLLHLGKRGRVVCVCMCMRVCVCVLGGG